MKEGINHYNMGEKNWRKVYKDEIFMMVLYGGWEHWLNSHGKLHRVGDDSSKIYSVMATWFDDSDTKAGEMSDGEELINDDKDNDSESGYASNIGVFPHAEKFRDKRTVPGPLKKDDIGGEESGNEDKAVKKGAVGKGKDNSARKQKKAKEKKGGGISASVTQRK